jgi:nicotinamide-nucleotide amidase
MITEKSTANAITHLAQLLASQLSQHSWSVVLAESCTGGLVCASLTEIAGSSAWFERGYITYSNQAKSECLGVSAELIGSFGAVSEEVAKAMAEGALKNSMSNLAIAITGIAGPTGGTFDKPVGTVCFGWAFTQLTNNLNSPALVKLKTQHFAGNRLAVRNQACAFALQGAVDLIHPTFTTKIP